jgi:hypothetical protein
MANKTKNEDWMGFGSGAPWVPGVVLILVGSVLLFANLTGYELRNWWALFILIPAISNFNQAYAAYRSSGKFDKGGVTFAFWGLFFVLLSGTFLLGFSIGAIWPVFLILGGLMLILGR